MSGKTILLTATYLVGIGELILAIFFWVTHSKSEIRKVMALLAFSTAMWVLTSAFVAYLPPSNYVFIATNFLNAFAGLALNSLVHLTLIFPFPFWRIDNVHRILIYFPLVIFSVILFTSKTIIQGFRGPAYLPNTLVGGPLLNLFYGYLLFLFLLSIIFLIAQYRRTDGLHNKNVKLVLFSVLMGALPAVIIDLIIVPYFPNSEPNYLIGVLSSVAWFGTTAYIVGKK